MKEYVKKEFRVPPPSQTNFIPTLSVGEYVPVLLCLSFKQHCHVIKPKNLTKAEEHGSMEPIVI